MRAALTLAVVLAVTNAPAQWEIQTAPTTADLRGIDNVGHGIVWASGSDGTVLRTTDEGATWQRCATPPGAEHLDFRGIQAFDEKTAIVMSSGKGPLSRLYKTTDACQIWKLLFTNPDPDGFWDSVRFEPAPRSVGNEWPPARARQGVLIGDPVHGRFAIYTSNDSGDTWQPWEPSDPQLPKVKRHPAIAQDGESIFAASNSALAAPGANGPFSFVTGGKGGSHLFLAQSHSPFDIGAYLAFKSAKISIQSTETSSLSDCT